MNPAALAAAGAGVGLRSARLQRAAGMLEPLRNPASWDNFRKVVVLVLILWAAVSAVLCIIYFFILGGRSPAPANIFRALILLVPFITRADHRTGSR
jgi:hypothetical protein